MAKYSFVSSYTVAQYKPHKKRCNNDNSPDMINRVFKDRKKLEVVVSDLTYVWVDKRWAYICTLFDLHNWVIIGHSAGYNKDANLVYQAFLNCNSPLSE